MEVGCGSGYVITLSLFLLGEESDGVQYIATDTNLHAVRVTRETMEAHGVHAELISTDIASGLEKRLAGLVDVMVMNPPYVPTPEDEVGREGITSAWDGGEDGRSVVDRILPVADNLLSSRVWLYLVTLESNHPWGYASRIVSSEGQQMKRVFISSNSGGILINNKNENEAILEHVTPLGEIREI